MPVATEMFHPGGSADVVKLEAAKVIAGPISLSFPLGVGNSGGGDCLLSSCSGRVRLHQMRNAYI